jgi:hypothetical protein
VIKKRAMDGVAFLIIVGISQNQQNSALWSTRSNVSLTVGKASQNSFRRRHFAAFWELRLGSGKTNYSIERKSPLGWLDEQGPAYVSSKDPGTDSWDEEIEL